MSDPRIVYRFHLADGVEEILLEFEPETYLLKRPSDQKVPEWAALEFHKCAHCPLAVAEHPNCPFAAALSRYVTNFGHRDSFDEVTIEVTTPTRRISARKPLQVGIASLVGLIGASSGCPHLSFYRPMARYHSPFADEQETLYRVLSMFTMNAMFAGRAPDFTDLAQLMDAVSEVNVAMAERIRAGFDRDAMINAIVTLDFFAMNVPLEIETKFNSLRHLFGE